MNANLDWNLYFGVNCNVDKIKEVGRKVPVSGNSVICCKVLTVSSTKLCARQLGPSSIRQAK